MLGTSSSKQSLQAYHPTPEIILSLWSYYIRNVDILVKLLYKPTAETLVLRASRGLKEIDTASEPLLFGIWFASVMTMSAEECWTLHGEERAALLRKYGYGLEKALAQAGWMTTQDVIVLQALTLLLVCFVMPNPVLLRNVLTLIDLRLREEYSYELDVEWNGHEYCSSHGFTS